MDPPFGTPHKAISARQRQVLERVATDCPSTPVAKRLKSSLAMVAIGAQMVTPAQSRA